MKILELFKKIDAKIDFLYGGIFGLIPFLFGCRRLLPFSAIACGILYAMGGDDDFRSAWRDIGCAMVVSLYLIYHTQNWLFLGAGVAVYGLFTIGLGLPSTQPVDEGSPVGRWAWRSSKHKEWLANLYTHAFLYVSAWAVYFTASILRGFLYA